MASPISLSSSTGNNFPFKELPFYIIRSTFSFNRNCCSLTTSNSWNPGEKNKKNLSKILNDFETLKNFIEKEKGTQEAMADHVPPLTRAKAGFFHLRQIATHVGIIHAHEAIHKFSVKPLLRARWAHPSLVQYTLFMTEQCEPR